MVVAEEGVGEMGVYDLDDDGDDVGVLSRRTLAWFEEKYVSEKNRPFVICHDGFLSRPMPRLAGRAVSFRLRHISLDERNESIACLKDLYDDSSVSSKVDHVSILCRPLLRLPSEDGDAKAPPSPKTTSSSEDEKKEAAPLLSPRVAKFTPDFRPTRLRRLSKTCDEPCRVEEPRMMTPATQQERPVSLRATQLLDAIESQEKNNEDPRTRPLSSSGEAKSAAEPLSSSSSSMSLSLSLSNRDQHASTKFALGSVRPYRSDSSDLHGESSTTSSYSDDEEYFQCDLSSSSSDSD